MLACIQGAGRSCRDAAPDLPARTAEARRRRREEGALGRDQRRRGPPVRCDRQLAMCEGIETGLAVHLATGKPVWAGINAGNLEKLWLPDTVRKVCIYADNDADGDFAGQCFAFALARRLKREEKTTGAAGAGVRAAPRRHRLGRCVVPTPPDQGRGQAPADRATGGEQVRRGLGVRPRRAAPAFSAALDHHDLRCRRKGRPFVCPTGSCQTRRRPPAPRRQPWSSARFHPRPSRTGLAASPIRHRPWRGCASPRGLPSPLFFSPGD
jgi:hypothetical protein